MSMVDLDAIASSAAWSTGCPSANDPRISVRCWGRGRLPVWVVKIRPLLCFIFLPPYCFGLRYFVLTLGRL